MSFSSTVLALLNLNVLGIGRPGGVGITKLQAIRENIRYVDDGSLNVPSLSITLPPPFLLFSDFLSSRRYSSYFLN